MVFKPLLPPTVLLLHKAGQVRTGQQPLRLGLPLQLRGVKNEAEAVNLRGAFRVDLRQLTLHVLLQVSAAAQNTAQNTDGGQGCPNAVGQGFQKLQLRGGSLGLQCILVRPPRGGDHGGCRHREAGGHGRKTASQRGPEAPLTAQAIRHGHWTQLLQNPAQPPAMTGILLEQSPP